MQEENNCLICLSLLIELRGPSESPRTVFSLPLKPVFVCFLRARQALESQQKERGGAALLLPLLLLLLLLRLLQL